jgi:hypothetical protein
LDVFHLREQLVEDYREYVVSGKGPGLDNAAPCDDIVFICSPAGSALWASGGVLLLVTCCAFGRAVVRRCNLPAKPDAMRAVAFVEGGCCPGPAASNTGTRRSTRPTLRRRRSPMPRQMLRSVGVAILRGSFRRPRFKSGNHGSFGHIGHCERTDRGVDFAYRGPAYRTVSVWSACLSMTG